jgi:4-hydroxy-3-methylbut-2-enyl diphosphate reductase
VIVGDRGHAEVEGLMGFSKGLGTVVSSVEDAEALPPGGKVCVVAQTTQDLDVFEGVARRINERASACVVCDTVCRSTRERQKETIAMARATDAMVVVGGRSSANTARLVKICEKVGVPVFHVESERELNDIPLHRYGRIGVTAGASTPRAVIERVVEAIRAQRAPQVRRSYRARRRS